MIESFISFHDVEPEIAEAEVRVLNLLEPQLMLPAGGYAAVEFYCPDPECDCRTVLLRIAGEHFPQGYLASDQLQFRSRQGDGGAAAGPCESTDRKGATATRNDGGAYAE